MNVWGRHFLTISLASFLLLSEIGGSLLIHERAICLRHLRPVYLIILVVNTAIGSTNPSDFPSNHLLLLIAIGLFISLGASTILTLLIAYRIHSTCKGQIRQGSKGIFNHILEIVLHSAALHAFVSFLTAVTSIIPLNDHNYELLYSVQVYISVIYPCTAVS